MNRLVLGVVLATVAASFTPSAHAGPLPGGPAGQPCGLTQYKDNTADEAGWQVGVMRAGPLVTAESGVLVCSVHVNNDWHNGSSVLTTSYDSTGGLLVAASPQVVHFQATAADDISLCSEWRGAGGTLYWVSGNVLAGGTGYWSSSPSNCGVLLSFEPNDPECSTWLWADQHFGTSLAPFWQDCESYEPLNVPGPTLNGQCSDGIDNDLDGRTDWSDPDCASSGGTTEGAPSPRIPTECNDGVDNDGDGWTDYPADPDCTSALDTSESSASASCTPVAGVPVCASYTPGTNRTPYTVNGPTTTGVPVSASIDLYQFTLPNGGTVALPCASLASGPNPCAAAGGTYLSNVTTLGPATVPVPTGALATPVTTVYLCDANLVLTVAGIGVTSFPGYAPC